MSVDEQTHNHPHPHDQRIRAEELSYPESLMLWASSRRECKRCWRRLDPDHVPPTVRWLSEGRFLIISLGDERVIESVEGEEIGNEGVSQWGDDGQWKKRKNVFIFLDVPVDMKYIYMFNRLKSSMDITSELKQLVDQSVSRHLSILDISWRLKIVK